MTSVAVHALFKLSELTSNDRFRKVATAALERHAAELASFPQAYPHLASGADMARSPWREIVISGDAPDMLREIRRRYLPNTVVAAVPATGPGPEPLKLMPMLEGKKAAGGKAAAYVCENYTCKAPVTSAGELARILDSSKTK